VARQNTEYAKHGEGSIEKSIKTASDGEAKAVVHRKQRGVMCGGVGTVKRVTALNGERFQSVCQSDEQREPGDIGKENSRI